MEVPAMTLVVETHLLIEQCRSELMRLQQLAEDFKVANEISRSFLTGAIKTETPNDAEAVCLSAASRLKPDPREWRERAEQTRVFAGYVSESRAKRFLLEIAESYDQLGQ